MNHKGVQIGIDNDPLKASVLGRELCCFSTQPTVHQDGGSLGAPSFLETREDGVYLVKDDLTQEEVTEDKLDAWLWSKQTEIINDERPHPDAPDLVEYLEEIGIGDDELERRKKAVRVEREKRQKLLDDDSKPFPASGLWLHTNLLLMGATRKDKVLLTKYGMVPGPVNEGHVIQILMRLISTDRLKPEGEMNAAYD